MPSVALFPQPVLPSSTRPVLLIASLSGVNAVFLVASVALLLQVPSICRVSWLPATPEPTTRASTVVVPPMS